MACVSLSSVASSPDLPSMRRGGRNHVAYRWKGHREISQIRTIQHFSSTEPRESPPKMRHENFCKLGVRRRGPDFCRIAAGLDVFACFVISIINALKIASSRPSQAPNPEFIAGHPTKFLLEGLKSYPKGGWRRLKRLCRGIP
ncbi:unnamed protein product [Periconia digitata]|uniref:Uncharacterized protein n=1 Tax=Periconia digitata TaxID=1303443 RepID=A0A9W4U4R1_9PLEO|nr:unnamed protein product [Periconia digitata]